MSSVRNILIEDSFKYLNDRVAFSFINIKNREILTLSVT